MASPGAAAGGTAMRTASTASSAKRSAGSFDARAPGTRRMARARRSSEGSASATTEARGLAIRLGRCTISDIQPHPTNPTATGLAATILSTRWVRPHQRNERCPSLPPAMTRRIIWATQASGRINNAPSMTAFAAKISQSDPAPPLTVCVVVPAHQAADEIVACLEGIVGARFPPHGHPCRGRRIARRHGRKGRRLRRAGDPERTSVAARACAQSRRRRNGGRHHRLRRCRRGHPPGRRGPHPRPLCTRAGAGRAVRLLRRRARPADPRQPVPQSPPPPRAPAVGRRGDDLLDRLRCRQARRLRGGRGLPSRMGEHRGRGPRTSPDGQRGADRPCPRSPVQAPQGVDASRHVPDRSLRAGRSVDAAHRDRADGHGQPQPQPVPSRGRRHGAGLRRGACPVVLRACVPLAGGGRARRLPPGERPFPRAALAEGRPLPAFRGHSASCGALRGGPLGYLKVRLLERPGRSPQRP